MHKNVIILGAGLAGLTAAFELNKYNANYLLLEKSNKIGGTAKSVQCKGYTFDLTGHALHLNNENIKNLIFDELNLSENFLKVERKSYIYYDKILIPYPFQYNLAYLKEKSRNTCVIDFLKAHYSFNKSTKRNYKSFKEYCNKTLGNGISNIFMEPYNEKLWSINPKDMTADWMGNYLPVPDYTKIIDGAFIKKEIDNSGYNAYFYYPKFGGIQVLSDALYEKISKNTKFGIIIKKIDINLKKIYTNKDIISYNYFIIKVKKRKTPVSRRFL